MTEGDAELLLAVFGAFDRSEISWCWTKNHAEFPRVAGDADLAVHPRDLVQAVRSMRETAIKHKVGAFVVCSHGQVTACFLARPNLAPLEIDLKDDAWTWIGKRFLSVPAALSDRRRDANGYWTLSPTHEALILFFSAILGGRKVPRPKVARAIRRIRSLEEDIDWNALTHSLGLVLGRVVAVHTVRALRTDPARLRITGGLIRSRAVGLAMIHSADAATLLRQRRTRSKLSACGVWESRSGGAAPRRDANTWSPGGGRRFAHILTAHPKWSWVSEDWAGTSLTRE